MMSNSLLVCPDLHGWNQLLGSRGVCIMTFKNSCASCFMGFVQGYNLWILVSRMRVYRFDLVLRMRICTISIQVCHRLWTSWPLSCSSPLDWDDDSVVYIDLIWKLISGDDAKKLGNLGLQINEIEGESCIITSGLGVQININKPSKNICPSPTSRAVQDSNIQSIISNRSARLKSFNQVIPRRTPTDFGFCLFLQPFGQNHVQKT